MSAISNLGPTDPNILTNTSGSSSFGDNPFLQLLTTQLRNQTPLEPMDNGSFMEQVATFSSMEEQQDLNKNMLALLDYQGLLARMQGLSQGSALLGKEVSYVRDGIELSGDVDSVYVGSSGELRLKVGEDDIEMGSIISITQSAGAAAAQPPTTTPATT